MSSHGGCLWVTHQHDRNPTTGSKSRGRLQVCLCPGLCVVLCFQLPCCERGWGCRGVIPEQSLCRDMGGIYPGV